jgi:hypothetical protein
MNEELNSALTAYAEYAGHFAKQIFDSETWKEHTGCDVDEYFGYISCCEGRLYDFSTWYEHAFGVEFPVEWMERQHFKHALLEFNA